VERRAEMMSLPTKNSRFECRRNWGVYTQSYRKRGFVDRLPYNHTWKKITTQGCKRERSAARSRVKNFEGIEGGGGKPSEKGGNGKEEVLARPLQNALHASIGISDDEKCDSRLDLTRPRRRNL